MKPSSLASFGALTAIVVAAVAYIASLGVSLGPSENRTTVSITVAETNGLVVGSNVLLRGVPIGKVDGLRPDSSGALVTFYYDDAYQIPLDSEIRVDNLSALGETYIGLLPRTKGGPVLQDGQSLTTEKVTQPPSVAQLSADVVHLLDQVNPEELARVVTELDGALPDGSAVLPNLSRTSALLADTIESRPGQGREILANLQSLLRNADFVGPAIASAGPDLASVGPAYQGLVAASIRLLRETGAPESVNDFGAYLARVQKFLDESAPDIQTLSQALLPNMRRIGAATKTVDVGALLDSALAAVPADGPIILHLTVPAP